MFKNNINYYYKIYFNLLFLILSIISFSQNVIFKDIETKVIVQNLKIFNQEKFMGITNSQGMIKLDVSKNYTISSETYEKYDFFLKNNQNEVLIRKRQTLKNISKDEIINLIKKFQSSLVLDYQNSTFYEKFSYDYLENDVVYFENLHQDSITKIIKNQQDKNVDYVQEQFFKLDEKNQKKIILEKNAGIGKSSFLNFNNSKINPTIFKINGLKWIKKLF